MTAVTVRWGGGTIEVPQGTLLSDALRMGGVHLDMPCGGRGRCGKCAVLVEYGSGSESSGAKASGERPAPERRLACQFRVDRDVTVFVPAIPPAVPLEAGVPDSMNAIETMRANRPAAYFGSVDPWITLPASGPAAGLAIDLGTTSIALSLVDLRTGEELASSARPNPQAAFGADIMSRLLYATSRSRNNGTLQRLALESITDAFSELLKASGLRREDVLGAVLVANTAMHHLALGLSVKDLSVHPYTAATLKPREADIPGLPRLYAPPVVWSFVGSDLVAAAIATGIAGCIAGAVAVEDPVTRLLIDVGTNSEVLLSHQGRLYACSAPAGPAFEGGEISQGMLALPGAVFEVSDNFELSVVGGGQPKGICGSGIVDTIAALLRAGVLDENGLMRAEQPFADRIIHETDGSLKFMLAPGLFLTQKDIRAVQLAKGALRCAVDALLDEAGAVASQIDAVYLAGAFGTSLRVENALEIGLVPPIAPARVKQVGNGAIQGAKAILLSACAKAEAERLAKAIRHVDLASLEDFQDRFLASLSFGPGLGRA